MQPVIIVALAALLLTGAIFGFFFAWVCSTMWGLDRLPPATAIAAMQAMNASVRNIVFAPAFFGTGPALLLAGAVAWRAGLSRSAGLFAGAAVVYLLGAFALTLIVNVPMNEALAAVDPDAPGAAGIWSGYSARWQRWNQIRTLASGLSLLLAGIGIHALRFDGRAART